eukprot:1381820-Amorphochlora_amoeboformis.AAC.1
MCVDHLYDCDVRIGAPGCPGHARCTPSGHAGRGSMAVGCWLGVGMSAVVCGALRGDLCKSCLWAIRPYFGHGRATVRMSV